MESVQPVFYLGTHKPGWLAQTDVRLFVSRRTLGPRKTLPVARAEWMLDSGGFTELNMFGTWQTTATVYAEEVERFADQVGKLKAAAIQDWMCEPFVLDKTGKTVAEHQTLTVQSYLDLVALAPAQPWMPVLQGWRVDDYLDHVALYRAAGIDLSSLPVVGVGSVCRRQGTLEIAELFAAIHRLGIRAHGFGLKTQGLRASWPFLASADSLAWSYQARRRAPLPGCKHRSCANCMRYALKWRAGVLRSMGGASQHWLAFGASESTSVMAS